jgi:RecA/RadA recombinase
VPTGALALDLALGVGGLPRGRVTEIYGPESSGKSTLAMHVVAEAQRNGGICAYIDAEHAMDPVYARRPSGSTSTSCSSPSPTRVSRRSRSPTCWCAPARSTWW